LDNGGETLQLDRPGPVDADNVQQYVRQDRVNYDDNAPWPTAPDGHGSSLNRVIESDYGNDFSNWMAAVPSPGAPSSESPADSDGDGMPDAWELNHFGNLSHDGTGDYDGDGVSDFAEYRAGTDPLNPNDGLQLHFAIEAGNATVNFIASAGKAYTVQYKTSLTDSEWLTLRDVSPQGATTVINIIDPDAPSISQRFYRLVIP
jgi:hypothetical protein